jgi:hypothetical protein
VHQPAHARLAARRDHVLGPAHVEPLEVGRVAPVLDLGGGVEADLAGLGAGAHGAHVVEVTGGWLGAALAHSRRRGVGARQRADLPALASEALDQSASDEARPSCDEGPYPRFGMPSPQSVPEHGLCDTSVTFALPLLSRETRKLVQAVLLVLVVSRKLPSGFDVETR